MKLVYLLYTGFSRGNQKPKVFNSSRLNSALINVEANWSGISSLGSRFSKIYTDEENSFPQYPGHYGSGMQQHCEPSHADRHLIWSSL